MAQQNALVGVAQTAFYPQFTISGGGGFQSISIGSLITAPSAFWAVGGDLLQPIFNGGRNRATLAATKSSYDESVANYRQSVLVAFQQVEDGLVEPRCAVAGSCQPERCRQFRPPFARTLQQPLRRRSAAYLDVITAQVVAAQQPALGDPIAWPADGHFGLSGQGIGRRLGRIRHPERRRPSQGHPDFAAVRSPIPPLSAAHWRSSPTCQRFIPSSVGE